MVKCVHNYICMYIGCVRGLECWKRSTNRSTPWHITEQFSLVPRLFFFINKWPRNEVNLAVACILMVLTDWSNLAHWLVESYRTWLTDWLNFIDHWLVESYWTRLTDWLNRTWLMIGESYQTWLTDWLNLVKSGNLTGCPTFTGVWFILLLMTINLSFD